MKVGKQAMLFPDISCPSRQFEDWDEYRKKDPDGRSHVHNNTPFLGAGIDLVSLHQ